MWQMAVGWGIAVLSIGVSANWFAGRQTRSLRRLKSEADLLAVLPDSDGKSKLHKLLDRELQSYVRSRRFGPLTRRRRTVRAIEFLRLVLAVLLFGLGVALIAKGDELPRWIAPVSLAATVLFLIGPSVIIRRLEQGAVTAGAPIRRR
ncbi:hypothetical protein [Nocardioides sp. SYSU DS0663]|uniref:hypothetical protein n=1 Tax=Nocardioides sp. SYSU DS0663 TaxID=3416445 RepID=UPI003F4AFD72